MVLVSFRPCFHAVRRFRADAALYQAKRSGRGTFRQFDEAHEPPEVRLPDGAALIEGHGL